MSSIIKILALVALLWGPAAAAAGIKGYESTKGQRQEAPIKGPAAKARLAAAASTSVQLAENHDWQTKQLDAQQQQKNQLQQIIQQQQLIVDQQRLEQEQRFELAAVKASPLKLHEQPKPIRAEDSKTSQRYEESYSSKGQQKLDDGLGKLGQQKLEDLSGKTQQRHEEQSSKTNQEKLDELPKELPTKSSQPKLEEPAAKTQQKLETYATKTSQEKLDEPSKLSPPKLDEQVKLVQQKEEVASKSLPTVYRRDEQQKYEQLEDQLPQQQQQLVDSREENPERPPNAEAEPYSFSYESEHSARSESGDTKGTVRGFYRLSGPDGSKRIVDYIADHQGFRANIRTNEFGTDSKSPSSVVFQSSQPSQEELARAASFEQIAQSHEDKSSKGKPLRREEVKSPKALVSPVSYASRSDYALKYEPQVLSPAREVDLSIEPPRPAAPVTRGLGTVTRNQPVVESSPIEPINRPAEIRRVSAAQPAVTNAHHSIDELDQPAGFEHPVLGDQ